MQTNVIGWAALSLFISSLAQVFSLFGHYWLLLCGLIFWFPEAATIFLSLSPRLGFWFMSCQMTAQAAKKPQLGIMYWQ